MGRLAARHARWPKDRSFITSDGARLAYTVVGDELTGLPVVLMNGWTCPDTYWAGIVPRLTAAGHPVVVFDTRGHGQSGLPERPGCKPASIPTAHVSVPRLALDLVELIDESNMGRAVLAGHSMGVQGIFEAYRIGGPSTIAGLVPIAGTYENPVPTFAGKAVLDRLFPIADTLFTRLPLASLRPLLNQATLMPPALTMRVIGTILGTNEVVGYDDVAPHVRQIADVNVAVMWRIMSGMRNHSAADVLPGIEIPVLVLAGARDFFTPLAVQERMAARCPHAELVVFPEGGHLLPVEEAPAVAAAMIAWLAGID